MSSEKFIRNKTALITLIAASLVVLISLGVRQTFGMFFMDFKDDLGISLTQSGLSIGIQMLMWGLTGPIFGAIADKYGGHKAIVLAFLSAAFLTPPDPFSQISLALPIIFLYEVSIYIAKLIQKNKDK